MYRQASRSLLRSTRTLNSFRSPAFRCLNTAPPVPKSRSWKNTATRWGLALGAVYYYNTSTLFAEEPDFALHERPASDIDDKPLPTLASLTPSSRSAVYDSIDPTLPPIGDETEDSHPQSPEDLESQASSEGAFNEETGEINWDCPCLGGMAHGPCGENFRAAFSCFVFSKEEPKGMDCIEHFKGMQDCFRDHPDVYGAELEDDDDDDLYEEGEGLGSTEEGEGKHEKSATEVARGDATEGGDESGIAQTRQGVAKNSLVQGAGDKKPKESSKTPRGTATSKSDASEAVETKPSPSGTILSSSENILSYTPTKEKEEEKKEPKSSDTSSAQSTTKRRSSPKAEQAEKEELVPKAAFDAREPKTEK